MNLDFSGVLIAALGAFGGVAATALGTYYRNRRLARTSALLVYCELVENAAQVRYFRALGTWPQASLRQAAWEQNSVTLARLSAVKDFLEIRKGYGALEGIAYMARTPSQLEATLSKDALAVLIEHAVDDVAQGLRAAGAMAGVDRAVLDGEVGAMSQPAPKSADHTDSQSQPAHAKSKS